jgi:hypothetical protein
VARPNNNCDGIEALLVDCTLTWQTVQCVAVTLDLVATERPVDDGKINPCLPLRKRQFVDDGGIRLIRVNQPKFVSKGRPYIGITKGNTF